jgi:non-heme chloroperoxidase
MLLGLYEAFASHVNHKRTLKALLTDVRSSPKPDMVQRDRNVRFVPTADICSAAFPVYWRRDRSPQLWPERTRYPRSWIGNLNRVPCSLTMQTPYKSIVARAPDGVSIAVQNWGNPAGPEILFIHGFSQASLSWARQTSSELSKEFRIVTYDLCGHGNSDKPLEPEKYKDSKRWADEVNAVMETAKLKRPVLVGWSYGGAVIADYLKVHGTGNLAGLNLVDTVINSDPSYFGEGLKVQPLMFSEDLATNVAATRQFLRNCFEKQPSQDDFETMLAFNMMVPPKVRANMAGRTLVIEDILAALTLPVLVTHGAADRIAMPAAAKYTAAKISGAKLSLYDGIGHAPFWEDAARFNAELATFVRAANKTN